MVDLCCLPCQSTGWLLMAPNFLHFVALKYLLECVNFALSMDERNSDATGLSATLTREILAD